MMRIMTYNRFVTPETWQHWFRKECEKRGIDPSFLMPENIEYKDMHPKKKVLVLKQITDWQFDIPERFRAVAKEEDECVHWRVNPVGWDAKGGTYWLFDDNRLYREIDHAEAAEAELRRKQRQQQKRQQEANKRAKLGLSVDPPSKKRSIVDDDMDIGNGSLNGSETKLESTDTLDSDPNALNSTVNSNHNSVVDDADEVGDLNDGKTWELVCRTLRDWQEFPRQFEGVKMGYEKSLYDALVNGVGKQVVQNLQEKEELEVKRIQEMEYLRLQEEELQTRKRSSRLGNRMVEQLERERKEMIERDLRKGLGEWIDSYDLGVRSTRSRASMFSSVHEPPKSGAEKREERLKRRMAKLEDSPIPESVLVESVKDIVDNPTSLEQPFNDENDEKGEMGALYVNPENPDSTKVKRGKGKGNNKNRKRGFDGADDFWWFDCSCGARGRNFDDGLPMISCGRCNMWRHIYCIERKLGNPHPGPDVVAKWDTKEFTCPACQEALTEKISRDSNYADAVPEVQTSVEIAETSGSNKPLHSENHAIVSNLDLPPVFPAVGLSTKQPHSPQPLPLFSQQAEHSSYPVTDLHQQNQHSQHRNINLLMAAAQNGEYMRVTSNTTQLQSESLPTKSTGAISQNSQPLVSQPPHYQLSQNGGDSSAPPEHTYGFHNGTEDQASKISRGKDLAITENQE